MDTVNFDEIFKQHSILEILECNKLEELPEGLEKLKLLKTGAIPLILQQKNAEGDFLKEGCKMFEIDYEKVKKLLLTVADQANSNIEKKWFEFMEDAIFKIFKQAIKKYPVYVSETATNTQKPYAYLTMRCNDFVVDGFQIGLDNNAESEDWEGMAYNIDDFDDYCSLIDEIDTKDWSPTEEELENYCDDDEDAFFEILESSLCEILFEKVGEKLKNDPSLQEFITPQTKVYTSVYFSMIPFPFTSMPEKLRKNIAEQLTDNEDSKIEILNMWEDNKH